jgi:site-specific DNA-methyltransferase (adenine-specific)
MALMARYPDKYFDLAIVDPPYFKGVASGNFYGSNITRKGIKRKNSKSNNWDSNIPSENYYNELLRVSKHQIIWGINYFNFKDVPVGRLFWDKKNDTSTFSKGEIASCSLINSVQIFRHLWNGMLQENMKNKWICNHPSPKPPELYKWILDKYAKPNDKILDTHLGSGSIAIACYDYDFELTACEIDKEYYDKAIERIKNHVSQQKLF